jgi:hypothetical protein
MQNAHAKAARRAPALALALGLALAPAAPARAQALDLEPALRIGLLEIHPSLALTESWRDNVFATNEATESDAVTTITPALDLKLPIRAHLLSLGAKGDIVRYADFGELDTESFAGYGRAELNIGDRVNLRFGDTFTRAYESLLESPTGVSGRYDANAANVSLRYAFVDVSQLRLDYTYDTWDYQEETDGRDRAEGQLSAYLYFRFLPKTSAFVEYDLRTVAYDDPVLTAAGGTLTLDSQVHSGYAGASWEISPAITGTAKLGYQKKDFDDAALEDFSTWVASVELDHAISDAVRLKLAGGRRVNETKYTGPSHFTTTGADARLTIHFLDRLRGRLRAGFGRDEFSDPIVGDPEARTDDVSSFGAGLSYNFTSWLSLDADYAHFNRDSNIDVYSATENAFSLRVRAAL